MKTIRLLWLHLLPLRPFARIHCDWIKQPVRAGKESDGISCPRCGQRPAHVHTQKKVQCSYTALALQMGNKQSGSYWAINPFPLPISHEFKYQQAFSRIADYTFKQCLMTTWYHIPGKFNIAMWICPIITSWHMVPVRTIKPLAGTWWNMWLTAVKELHGLCSSVQTKEGSISLRLWNGTSFVNTRSRTQLYNVMCYI